ncbi:MAG: histidine phosphatase family protein [Acidobacteriota bacterium]
MEVRDDRNGDRHVVLLRHGDAERRAPNGRDEDRRLTAEGSAEMKEIAAGLARAFPDADAIFASPFTRAQETAARVAGSYGSGLTVETTDALVPGARSEELRRLLAGSPARRMILVGHEPSVSANTLALIGGPGASLEFRTGGACCVRLLPGGDGVLQWMLTSDLLRGLRG